MLCEMCGKEVPFLKPIFVEGSMLKVCAICAKFGKVMEEEPEPVSRGEAHSESRTSYGYTPPVRTKEEVIQSRLEHRARRMKSKDVYEQSGEKELVEDYHRRIQQARNSLGWSQEELGQKINERKSVISKLENRSMKPDDKVVRKLEKVLSIKLMEVIE